MANLLKEAAAVIAALNDCGAPYALVGGLAVSIYARPRATVDLDFVIEPDDFERVSKAVHPLGYKELVSPMKFKALTIRRLTKVMPDDAIWIDLILSDERLRPVLDRRQTLRWADLNVQIVSPDELIAMKRIRGSEQDMADIASLEEGLKDDAAPSNT